MNPDTDEVLKAPNMLPSPDIHREKLELLSPLVSNVKKFQMPRVEYETLSHIKVQLRSA